MRVSRNIEVTNAENLADAADAILSGFRDRGIRGVQVSIRPDVWREMRTGMTPEQMEKIYGIPMTVDGQQVEPIKVVSCYADAQKAIDEQTN